ncbi:MAG: hypothetical protein GKR90_11430 [Pseudomonadales bacterium]|nr:hypothetical protein [Pseudomonadales bacterium]
MLEDITRAIAQSEVRDGVIWLLMNVPGLPPILQSVHIIAVAVLIGTVGLTHLRILGFAIWNQSPSTLISRYRPWLGWTIGVAFLSGIAFVIARPARYFLNPVAGWKLGFFLVAIALTVFLFRREAQRPGAWRDVIWATRGLSLVAVVAWIGVIFAGRWIAYVDYLYWDE